MTSKPVLILEETDAFLPKSGKRFSMGELFIKAAHIQEGEAVTFDMEKLEQLNLRPENYSGVIVTGSLAMASDRLDWMLRLEDFLARCAGLEIPIFGVCFGHHMLAQALGGEVGYHPEGLELGAHEVEFITPEGENNLSGPEGKSSLLRDLPPRFAAYMAHSQTVTVPPRNAVTMARSAHDPHQILVYGPKILSVQFHPEFTPEIISLFFTESEGEDGGSPQKIKKGGLKFSPNLVQGLIRRFIDLAKLG
jgi:GMP synthase (glutamine-hydrolysing)